jgi:hypothetical protein
MKLSTSSDEASSYLTHPPILLDLDPDLDDLAELTAALCFSSCPSHSCSTFLYYYAYYASCSSYAAAAAALPKSLYVATTQG